MNKVGQPLNLGAERASIAGLLKHGSIAYVDTKEIIGKGSCFTDEVHQAIFKCVENILSKSTSVDIASVLATANVLGHKCLENKTGIEYIKDLFKLNISLENCVKYSVICRRLEIAREYQGLQMDAYSKLSEITGEESLDKIISLVEGPVFEYSAKISSGNEDSTVKISDGIDDYVANALQEQNKIVGIPSPWATYNTAIGGGRRRGGFYLIGARPKSFKSTTAVDDGFHVACLGTPVLYLDTEMNLEGQQPRLLAKLSNLSISDVESGNVNDFEKSRLLDSVEKLKSIPFYYRRIAGKPFDEILSIVRRWIVQTVGFENGRTRNCLVIYDYFKLMDTTSLKDMQEYQSMGFQAQSLTEMCIKYDFPCSAYVQLNRDGIEKDTSNVISQSDRLLWLCSSFAMLKRKSPEEIMTSGPENGNVKLIVTEDQRFGPGLEPGDWINLSVDGAKCSVRELGTRMKSKQSNSEFGVESSEEDDESDYEGNNDSRF